MCSRPVRVWWIRVASIFAAVLPIASQAQSITQTVPLHAGWNAVYLEADPPERSPATVFQATPIEIAARYFRRNSSVQYLRDPADAPWNEPGWGVWYAPSRPDAFLTSLHAIHGGHAYLVYSSSAFDWHVTGSAELRRVEWQADSYNLIGFPLDERAPPTFREFFAGAEGRIGGSVFRLSVAGKWAPVTAPATTTMRPGEACWVYCFGRTGYQGPLDVQVAGLGGLDFGETGTTLDIRLCNNLAQPMAVSIALLPGAGNLPVVRLQRDPVTLQTVYSEIRSPSESVLLLPGQPEFIRLGVRREAMTASEQSALLVVSGDPGVRFLIPVHAAQPTFSVQR